MVGVYLGCEKIKLDGLVQYYIGFGKRGIKNVSKSTETIERRI
jgi:hypothetical protein